MPATAGAYLPNRARLLDWRLRRFAGALRRGAVEDVEIRGGKLRVAPLSGRYKKLEPLIGRPINTGIVHECWDEVVWLTASLKAKRSHPR